MFWLQTPPWKRWALAALVAGFAIWVELRPDATVDHPFATQHIARGEPITTANTTTRRVPHGVFDPIPEGAVARTDIPIGAPVLVHDVGGDDHGVPEGWWIVTLEVPPIARGGDRVRVVVVDTGQVIEGFVSGVGDPDPFTVGGGSVAIPGEHAATVAAASVNGRVVVLVSTG